MTNDFKEKLLKWISGNYIIETTPTDQTSIINQTSITNNYSTLMTNDLGSDYSILFQVQSKNSTNNNTEFTVIVGKYTISSVTKGFIVVLDNQFNVLGIIKQFSSNVDFGIFEAFNVSDDGTFFGIELQSNNIRRFVMLNNFTLKLSIADDYKVIIKQSYNIPNTCQFYATQNGITNVIKCTGSSYYMIYGGIKSSSNYYPACTNLKINVGMENDWIDKVSTHSIPIGIDGINKPDDCLPIWDSNGDFNSYIFSHKVGTTSTSDYFIIRDVLSNTASDLNDSTSIDLAGYTIDGGEIYSIQTKITSMTKAITSISWWSGFTQESINIITIADISKTYSDPAIYKSIKPLFLERVTLGVKLYEANDIIFFQASNRSEVDANLTYTEIGTIIDNKAIYTGISTNEYGVSKQFPFMVANLFNLYNYYVQQGNTCISAQMLYNSLNYNGADYQALNSMVPNSVNIYDPNGVVIFPRNLYNRIVNNNTTIATVEVPNDFMNDVTIQLKELISQTNNIMVSDITEIVKNIYEELLINFVNSIIVKNSNDINNVIINNTASNRINNSVSNPSVLDYNNSKIGKYKINYANDTSVINPINPDLTFTGLSTNYIITVYVPIDYGITSIQLLSNDETTVYQTIDCSNLENDKYYTINQKMEVV